MVKQELAIRYSAQKNYTKNNVDSGKGQGGSATLNYSSLCCSFKMTITI